MSETPPPDQLPDDTPDEPDGGDEAVAVAEPTGPVCEKCEGALPDDGMAACPSCGWYASLGVYVEVEPQWEAATRGEAPAAAPSHLEVWAKLVPPWAWIVVGTTVAVATASLGVRMMTTGNPSLRTTWAVTQLFAGIVVALGCHLTAFFLVASRDTDLGVLDLVVNPLRAWLRLIKEMPRRLWVLNTANASLSASVFAALVIGGIPYDKVWDWGFEQPAKKSLVAAVAEKAGKGRGDKSMEEALDDFAGDAGVDDLDADDEKDAAERNRKKTDALVIGYLLTDKGRLGAVLLAHEHVGKLYYAGRVTPEFEDRRAASEFFAKLRNSRAPRPFITVPAEALWVEPRFTCRVTYNKRVQSGMLQGMKWEALLGEVSVPW